MRGRSGSGLGVALIALIAGAVGCGPSPASSMRDPVAINTARLVVNQSNSTTSGSSSATSVVDSSAAKLSVRVGPRGLEIVSLEVHPGWTEASRTQSADRLALRYVNGSAAVDIVLTSTGAGISSSVVAGSDR